MTGGAFDKGESSRIWGTDGEGWRVGEPAGRKNLQMEFQHIHYDNGTGTRSREVDPDDFHKAAAVLAEYGFDCIGLANDWRGADFLAHYSETSQTLRVQLKTGLVIDRKYGDGQGPYICFPRDKTCGRWYLVKHSGLVAIVRENTEWLCSAKRKQERRYGS